MFSLFLSVCPQGQRSCGPLYPRVGQVVYGQGVRSGGPRLGGGGPVRSMALGALIRGSGGP